MSTLNKRYTNKSVKSTKSKPKRNRGRPKKFFKIDDTPENVARALWGERSTKFPKNQRNREWGVKTPMLRDIIPKKREATSRCRIDVASLLIQVGARGFEPPTSSTPLKRATELRYAPTQVGVYHAATG